MTLSEARVAYYEKFGAEDDPGPAITWFSRLPKETQIEILMQGINNNTPITGKIAEEIEHRLYAQHYANPKYCLI
jgi:hypothetical protein